MGQGRRGCSSEGRGGLVLPCDVTGLKEAGSECLSDAGGKLQEKTRILIQMLLEPLMRKSRVDHFSCNFLLPVLGS